MRRVNLRLRACEAPLSNLLPPSVSSVFACEKQGLCNTVVLRQKAKAAICSMARPAAQDIEL